MMGPHHLFHRGFSLKSKTSPRPKPCISSNQHMVFFPNYTSLSKSIKPHIYIHDIPMHARHTHSVSKMISLKRLIAIAKKWQRMAGIKRRITISLPRRSHKVAAVANKGHFVVYTIDKGRFVVPFGYLRSKIFRELFRMSEEQFGLPTDGPITLPCDAAFMEYAVSLVRKHVSLELENAVQVVASFGFGLASCPITIGGGS